MTATWSAYPRTPPLRRGARVRDVLPQRHGRPLAQMAVRGGSARRTPDALTSQNTDIHNGSTVTLAACAEMLWRDRPIEWRCARLKEMGFEVGLWNWPEHDLIALERSGATFSIMNGYLTGRLADDEGADELLRSARATAEVGKRLGVARLNLHGTGSAKAGFRCAPARW